MNLQVFAIQSKLATIRSFYLVQFYTVCLGTISIVLVYDEYHREDGIVRSAPYARTAVRGSPAVLIRTETALRNGSTNIKKAKKILEYMSQRSVYHVQSTYIINRRFFQTMLGFNCLIISMAHIILTFSTSSLFVTSNQCRMCSNRYT